MVSRTWYWSTACLLLVSWEFWALPGEFELCLFGAFASEGVDDFAVDIKHLDAVIVRIGDDDAVCGTDSDVVWVLQLARSVTQTAELTHESTVRLKHLEHHQHIQ